MGLIRLAKLVSPYCIGMEGNISGKFNTHLGKALDGFQIKCSGVRLSDACQASDYVCISMSGEQIDNFNRRGSIEMELHRLIYNRYPDVKFIAHTHPINTLKILCGLDLNISIFAKMRMYPEQVIFNGASSIVVPYACPGPKLANELELKIQHYEQCPKLILLKNHGIVACGKTVDECVAITETCEKAAEVFISGHQLPSININFLLAQEVRELLDNEQEKYRLDQCNTIESIYLK